MDIRIRNIAVFDVVPRLPHGFHCTTIQFQSSCAMFCCVFVPASLSPLNLARDGWLPGMWVTACVLGLVPVVFHTPGCSVVQEEW